MMQILELMEDEPEVEGFLRDVLEGLGRPRKQIPSKYLYDSVGSALFDRICDLEEYYLTRSETEILQTYVDEIATQLGPDPVIFEFGSGSSTKTLILLDRLQREYDGLQYVPIDICREVLLASSAKLSVDYPGLQVLPIYSDFVEFSKSWEYSRVQRWVRQDGGGRVLFFPGSTLGNLQQMQALTLLRDVASFLGPGGKLLIGVDLVKDRKILEAAYNDASGITSEFSLNLLHRMNRELDAGIDVGSFSYLSNFNPVQERMEMYLVCHRSQWIEIAGCSVPILREERIRTEISQKYRPAQFKSWLGACGYSTLRSWTDSKGYFAVFLAEVA